jgi:hypothetical protein
MLLRIGRAPVVAELVEVGRRADEALQHLDRLPGRAVQFAQAARGVLRISNMRTLTESHHVHTRYLEKP